MYTNIAYIARIKQSKMSYEIAWLLIAPNAKPLNPKSTFQMLNNLLWFSACSMWTEVAGLLHWLGDTSTVNK